MTGQTPEDYSVRQGAYDLRKLRGKQLAIKPRRARRYHVPEAAARSLAPTSLPSSASGEPLHTLPSASRSLSSNPQDPSKSKEPTMMELSRTAERSS